MSLRSGKHWILTTKQAVALRRVTLQQSPCGWRAPQSCTDLLLWPQLIQSGFPQRAPQVISSILPFIYSSAPTIPLSPTQKTIPLHLVAFNLNVLQNVYCHVSTYFYFTWMVYYLILLPIFFSKHSILTSIYSQWAHNPRMTNAVALGVHYPCPTHSFDTHRHWSDPGYDCVISLIIFRLVNNCKAQVFFKVISTKKMFPLEYIKVCNKGHFPSREQIHAISFPMSFPPPLPQAYIP